jgi:hypothetical protein
MTAKALLRRLIVATSVPPFIALYHAVYRALIRFAVRRLRRFPSLRAVYLRRGLAEGRAIPGISDIDLAVVGDWDSGLQNVIAESWGRLARFCPLYDPAIGIYTPQSLLEQFQTDPIARHRLREGQLCWKLLFGEDCLRHLPPVSEDDAAVGYEGETRVWWTYFSRVAIEGWQSSDRVFVNSLCYKAVAECIRMDCGLQGRPLLRLRGPALQDALAEATGVEAEFLVRLWQSARRRHLSYRGEILADTHAFLLPFLERFHGRVRSHPAWRPLAGVGVRIDAPEQERLPPAIAPEGIFGNGWARVTLVSGTVFAMDEMVILCEPPPGELPEAAMLRSTAHACAQAFPNPRSRVSLYLRFRSMAVQFYASDHFRGWQAVLSPAPNPDIFHTGEWTAPAADFVHLERLLLVEALGDPVIYKANNLDFLRMFWKFLELVVVEHSAAHGKAVFAQTPEAVVRALECWNAPRPPFLESFARAYRSELAGSSAAIGRDLPAAIEYLKAIHHEL